MNLTLRELEILKKHILTMGGLVENATRKAVNALVHRRKDLVNEVIVEDREIDAIENTIDDEAQKILALHHPVAGDLRFVLTVMKVNNELERMGDHAKNIALAARYLCQHEPIAVYGSLEPMGEKVQAMVKNSLDSLVNSDAELASAVRAADEAVDQDYNDAFTTIQNLMHQDSNVIERCVQALTACRNLERIGDLATNIAKDVIFFVQGDIVRHGGNRADIDG